MKIDIITIFPGLFTSVFSESIIKKALDKNICEIKIHNLREYCEDKHKQVDDSPFGGGPGMVFKPEPLHKAITSLKTADTYTILTCPRGKRLTQTLLSNLSDKHHLIIIAAHYEGIDERITESLVDQSVSIGDYVLCGGELPSMVLCEGLIRLLPGVVGNQESLKQDSFQESLLDFPHYTRPANFLGQNVPHVLLSGSHNAIHQWRRQQSIIKTFNERPDTLAGACFSEEDKTLFENYFKT
ncbi:MAG: tRNA (guanosine(37)-N1)-methyltransferase TrmD [Candidatus Margulisiibacteriota bacterium]|nr:MAG: tRNA (guanosine(37)-N1)-methyltransferase TrmD [Candidatus Margulisbacteria bacterium GWD2_39_127]OGI03055.1 MAG: tRNA (guanosine(37)-N1)-methyltransferase TrmD [Candidatus Margulisbacteria bacterium GWF2_38_17]OGI11616.1 MAG: tRNA (guanosine(37)-N1)-methyltransferase TrmD [Candidatus Margulisbacteria bacterium GWE2_39_32]PZM79924.1 MAG: tRNA (guanosine(37)-N1)-methyltransferase TrmD [Candidatus Margulisiibacteriota bacterium]HAR62842.1 tRNA (guanosine(37)-N1)-methyltransferase TrmD [Ca